MPFININKSNKARKKAAKRLFNKAAGPFIEINLSAQPYVPKWMTRAYKNNRYVVMINDKAKTTHGFAIRVMIQRHDNEPIKNHWKAIQNIKNEIFGKDMTAIEYYPAEEELIDTCNMYWIFIYPDDILPKPIRD